MILLLILLYYSCCLFRVLFEKVFCAESDCLTPQYYPQLEREPITVAFPTAPPKVWNGNPTAAGNHVWAAWYSSALSASEPKKPHSYFTQTSPERHWSPSLTETLLVFVVDIGQSTRRLYDEVAIVFGLVRIPDLY